MNILMISPLTPESGSSVQFWSICRELGNLGHNVYYLERALLKNQKKTAKNIRYFRSIDFCPFLPLNILFSLFFNVIISIFIKADIVFVLKPLPNSCFPALIKKLFGAKIIIDIDDLDYEFYSNGLLKKIMRFFFGFFPKHFHKITFCSKEMKKHTVKTLGLSEDNTIFLPQGIDYDIFQIAGDNQNLREQFHLGKYKILVYLASLGITNSLVKVLEIFKLVSRKTNQTKLLVIGGGNHLEQFMQIAAELEIEDKVIFTGFVEHKAVPQYLRLADMAINYMEINKANKFRVPIKSREYLAAGLPIVSNLTGDDPDIADYIYQCNSQKDFADTIIDILDGEGDDRNSRGKRFVEKNYDWQHIIKNFNITLNSMIRKK